MRIEPAHTNPIPPQAERARPAEPPAAEPSRARDRVDLSERTRQVQRAAEAAAEAPDVRADRVAALKQQIGEGTYAVDSHVLAEKLLSHM